MSGAVRLIGIAGPSCSGKTTLARAVATRLGGAAVVSLDAYYHDRARLPEAVRATGNFDHPAALDRARLVRDVGRLAAGLAIRVPVYDFATHARSGLSPALRPGRHVVLEGLHTLYWLGVRRHLRLGVFLEISGAAGLERRLGRDVLERGRTPGSVRRQYESTVRPMAARFVLPTRGHADLVLSGAASPEDNAAIVASVLEERAD